MPFKVEFMTDIGSTSMNNKRVKILSKITIFMKAYIQYEKITCHSEITENIM